MVDDPAGLVPISTALLNWKSKFAALAPLAEPRPPALEPEPACPRCQGAGRVLPPLEPGHVVRRESRLCPVCGPPREAARLARTWPVPPEFADMATRNIRTPVLSATSEQARHQAEVVRRAVLGAIDVLRRVVEDWPGVLVAIDGTYGTAKTHMLAKLWAKAQAAGRSAIYVTAPSIEQKLTNFEHEEDATPLGCRRDLEHVDVLLIDEADRYSHDRAAAGDDGNTYFERQYTDLISARLMHQRLTVLAGNRLRERLHPAVVSRINAGVWIDLGEVPDMRPHFGKRWTP